MIKDNLKEVLASLKPGVELVAVSKYHPIEAAQEAYDAGQRVFGESREQELRVKYEALPKDIRWHFIGHLQDQQGEVYRTLYIYDRGCRFLEAAAGNQ